MAFRRGEEIDRLSGLPDSILIHILCFLPTKDAVRTVLTRRFGALWTSLASLDLDDSHFDELWKWNDNEEDELNQVNHGFFEFVRNVLRLHQRPTLDFFRVNINTFFFDDIKANNLGHELDSWLSFALRKQVKVLEFGFGMVEPDLELYKLPFTEFVSDSVTDLTLEFIEMKLQRRVQMGSLTVLRLIRVELSDYVFREIIQGCPLLKELEIFNCSDLFEVNFSTANLQKLNLDITEFGMYGSNRLNCPKLRWLELAGCVECLEIMDLSSVVDVVFSDGPRHEFNAFAQFKSALSKLLHCKSVSLSKEYVTVLESQLTNELSEEPEYWSTLRRVIIRSNSSSAFGALINLAQVLLQNANALDEMVIYSMGKVDSSVDSELTTDQMADLSGKLQRFSKASKNATVMLVC